MVKILIDASKTDVEIQFSGNPLRVAAELATAIAGIHQAMAGKDSADGRLFRKSIERFLCEGSPAWEGGMDMTVITVPKRKDDGDGNQG